MNLFLQLISAHLISSFNISLLVYHLQVPFIMYIRTNRCINNYFISYFVCLFIFNYEYFKVM
jgi:hypothetical protein